MALPVGLLQTRAGSCMFSGDDKGPRNQWRWDQTGIYLFMQVQETPHTRPAPVESREGRHASYRQGQEHNLQELMASTDLSMITSQVIVNDNNHYYTDWLESLS